jgi:hypothetical protein
MAEVILGGGGGGGGEGEVVTIIDAGVACRANDFCGSCSASGLTSPESFYVNPSTLPFNPLCSVPFTFTDYVPLTL